MKQLSSKYTLIAGLLILFLSAVSIFLNHQGFALRLINVAFWLFILSTMLYLWEIKKINEK